VYQAFQNMEKYSRMADTYAFEGDSLDLQDGYSGSSFERSQKTAKTSVKITDNPTCKQLSPQELSLEHQRYSNLLCFKK
jgi:hypothetical protein